VFRNIERFEGRSSLAGWIFTIATNRARTRITAEGRTVGLPGLDGIQPAVDPSNFRADGHWIELPALWDVLDPERIIGGRQLWDLVQEALELLPAAQKACVILRDIENRSSEEACEILGVSAENQRVLLHRARGRIRAAIDTAMGKPGEQSARAGQPVTRVKGKQQGRLQRLVVAVWAWMAGGLNRQNDPRAQAA
jgi:RNA polymerase sigma-70 factor (ECF subfamily)